MTKDEARRIRERARVEAAIEPLYRLLCKLAKEGKVCPDDAGLAAMLDMPRTRLSWYFRCLRLWGRISVTLAKTSTKGQRRVRIVTITEAGAVTGKPELSKRAKRGRQHGWFAMALSPGMKEKVAALLAAGLSQTQIAAKLRIGRRAVQRAVSELRLASNDGLRGRQAGETDSSWMRVAPVIPNDRLYGDLAPAILKLRQRGYLVCKSETVGHGKGRFVVGTKLMSAEDMVAMSGVNTVHGKAGVKSLIPTANPSTTVA